LTPKHAHEIVSRLRKLRKEPAMSHSPPLSRWQVRAAHLALGAVSFLAVYSPTLDAESSRMILRVLVLPGLAASGVVLWKIAVVRRWLAARRGRALVS
jgi:hypothetical protein